MSKKKSFWKKKITRREFLKKGVIAAAGIAAGAYAIDSMLKSSMTIPTSKSTSKDLWKWSKEARFYTPYLDHVKCNLCPNGCTLRENERGLCRTRINKGGKLYTLAYGNPCAVHTDPIEKKPLFHFLPGTLAFSIATAGCNLRCRFCQNWQISQVPPEETENYDMLPEDTVQNALNQKLKNSKMMSIAYTYSEPTAFYEYMTDTASIAKEKGIRNVVITAGYMNPSPMIELAKNVDAIKIDLKGFNEKFYRETCSAELSDVLSSLRTVKESGTLLEIINLVVPNLNDNIDEIRAMSKWIKDNLGPDVPLHFSRFHPDYQLRNLPATPMETLQKSREVAMDEGLHYVYIGNVVHGNYENTYCPKCNTLLIERHGYIIKQNNINNGKCNSCDERIAGVWV